MAKKDTTTTKKPSAKKPPSKNNLTYIVIDRSGSMTSLWGEALGSINTYIENIPKTTKVIVSVFDDNSIDVIRNTTAGKCAKITNEDALPRGMTPLYDATGKAIDEIIKLKPTRSVLVVMTDGHENASREYTLTDIKSKLKLAKKKKCEAVFLGANFDDIGKVTDSLGVAGTRSVKVIPLKLENTYRNLALKTSSYFTEANASYAATTMDFSETEKEEAGS